MIIVSHNVGYISNNCNKFALLHDAQLKMYDDFEEAYSEFRTKIGIADKQITSSSESEMAASSRKQMIEVTNSTALHDERFLNLVLEADIAMQAKRWTDAKAVFEKAFELFPYNGVYWNQWAHACKEVGDFEFAEIGYRTAAALGQSVRETEEFMPLVLKKCDRFPADRPLKGLSSVPTHEQPPGIPDLELFARSAWGVKDLHRSDLIKLMRDCEDLDSALAAMVKDERFAIMHKDWIEAGPDPKVFAKRKVTRAGKKKVAELWAGNLTCIAQSEKEEKGIRRVSRMIETMLDALPVLIALDGFRDWPKTQSALRERFV